MNDSQWQQVKINCKAGLVPSQAMVDALIAEVERLQADKDISYKAYQLAADIAEDATTKKYLLAANTPEHQYQQARADVARVICAVFGQYRLLDRYGEEMFNPEG